jgi:hypothetical protein
MKPENRRWHFYYLAGMPAELCDGGGDLTYQEAAAKIMEECPGHREAFIRSASQQHNKAGARRGSIFAGRRFILVCEA